MPSRRLFAVWLPVLVLTGLVGLAAGQSASVASPLGSPLQAAPNGLPPGFKMEVFATGLHTPRFLSFSPQDDLYAAEFGPADPAVKVLPDRNHDGVADTVITFTDGLDVPNNVIFRGGDVFVGDAGKIYRYEDADHDLVADNQSVLIDNLPPDGQHRTKTIGFGPDGKLYLNIGALTDDSPEAPDRGTIWQYNADGSNGRVYARGLRNTVGFDWNPSTKQLWGVDNGANDLGPYLPPDELNLLVDGGDYGFPFCFGDRQPNPNLQGANCANTIPAAVTFTAHSAPLGMTFYTGNTFPQAYWGGVFVALHGAGHPELRAIGFIPFSDGKPSGPTQTFLATGDSWTGLAVDPRDGSLYAAQDGTGTIYRISYTGSPADTPAPVDTPTAAIQPTPSAAFTPAPTARPTPQPAGRLPGDSQCFPETGKCLRGAFLDYWSAHGGLSQFGLPVTDELTEKLSDGKSYTVQYTERARFELHPEYAGTDAQVLLGRLGADLAAPRSGEDPFKAVPQCTGCSLLYFPETNHAIGAELQSYWQQNGGIPVFGYPLSEAFNEKSQTDGKTYLVQYFERNRLEYHPENKGTQYEVLLGLLGVQSYQDRYDVLP